MTPKPKKLFTKKQLQAFGELMFEEGRKSNLKITPLIVKHPKHNKAKIVYNKRFNIWRVDIK